MCCVYTDSSAKMAPTATATAVTCVSNNGWLRKCKRKANLTLICVSLTQQLMIQPNTLSLLNLFSQFL